MSKIEVNTIEPQCGTTLTVGAVGTTVAVPSNVVKSNALQASDAGNIISQSGTTITLGATGDSINLASGATQSGFGRTGTVDWDTTVKTTTVTAVNGTGYFVNTTAGAITVNLPAGVAGNIVAINDYARTASTNNITINSNGSENIEGSTSNKIISISGTSTTLVYVDSTQGWKVVDTGEISSVPTEPLFTIATGGTITCCGDYKIHKFTGPGTFCVSQVGNAPTNPTGGPLTVSYMVVAGGGGGGPGGGAGGAGGFREGRDISPSYTASPLVAPSGLTIAASPYPITVGAGGTNPSIFSSITSAGGGGGGTFSNGSAGGSGGGGSGVSGPGGVGGSGNTPPVSPPQGNNGGTGQYSSCGSWRAGGGGGATAVGANATPSASGNGGAGITTSITASSVTYGGGAGGGTFIPGTRGTGGAGGGGNGAQHTPRLPGSAGTANTGGGGGGGSYVTVPSYGGGSGIVVIRYKFQ